MSNMDKELKNAIMALPQMKERLKRLYGYAGEKYKMEPECISVQIRLSTKTVANSKEDETSMDLNNKLRELIEKPI
jgi:hypothetical protein